MTADRHMQEASSVIDQWDEQKADLSELHSLIASSLAAAEKRGREEELLKQPFDVKRFEKAPCYVCGYQGHSYFQPNVHMCAERYHAAIRARKDEP